MPVVTFSFVSGEVALTAEVCFDATVATFTKLLLDKGFTMPPDGLSYTHGTRQTSFHSRDSCERIWNACDATSVAEDSPSGWILILSSEDVVGGRVRTLDDIGRRRATGNEWQWALA